jgi:predicted phage terminase large subunit-like protein
MDCAHVVSHQRIHVDDLSGAIKDQDRKLRLGGEESPWVFLEMPMHFAPERKMVDRGYGSDWRSERGELLFPELLTPVRVKQITAGLSRYGVHQVEAQLEQNPQRQDGALFKMPKIREEVFADFPREFEEVHRFWDLAGSEDGECETAGALVGRVGEDFYLLDMNAEKLDGDDVEKRVETVAAMDWSVYMRDSGESLRSSFEREPGSGGKRDAQVKERKWQAWQIKSVPPNSSKRVRAGQLATIIANGRYHMPMDAPWYKETYAQKEVFTGENSGMKDRVDGQSGAVLEILHPTHRNKQLVVRSQTQPWEPDSYKPFGKCECCKRPAFADGGHCCQECRDSGGHRHSPGCHSSFNDWYVRQSRDE